MSSTKTCEASKAVMMKANITYSFLRQYICKIQNQLPAKERTLCLQWFRKLRPSKDSTENSLKYIERMLNEMMEGYLCHPFNATPPEGALPPLPPPHAHSEGEPSLESLLSDATLQSEEYNNRQESKVNKTTAVVPMPSETSLQTEGCKTSRTSNVKKPTGGPPLEFLLEVDESEMSSLNTISSDGDLDVALETRSEPNRQSKSHLRGYSLDVTRWSEETGTNSVQKHVHRSGQTSEESNIKAKPGDSELSKNWEDGSQELASEVDKAGAEFRIHQLPSTYGKVFENGLANKIEMETSIALDVLTKTGNDTNNKDLMRGEDQVDDLDTGGIALHYADIVKNSAREDKLEDRGDGSLKLTESVANFEQIIEHTTKIEKANSIESYRSYTDTLGNDHRDKTKEIQEVFLNKNFTSETGDLLLDFTSDGDFEKSHHVFDMLVKFANCYEKRGTKSLAIEEKVRTLTKDNENLIALNRKYKAKIQNLLEKIRQTEGGYRDLVEQTDEEAEHCDIDKQAETADVQNDKTNKTSADATTSMKLVNVESKETTAVLLVSGEKLEDLTTKLNTLINKSNFHNEKLAALDVKFNLVRDDYELERREMILKFKAIDSLHQNILTELVKRQMSEAREYQHLIDHYRARFSEKNAEIARLQNNACDACARRMTSGKDKVDGKQGHGDVDDHSEGSESIGEELKLRREIDRLRQTNKELIYTYERKIKRLMNEKYLESKLKDTILKAQREELELHLSGTKHEELRALADRLESQYSRVVDEAMRQAVSKLDVVTTATINVKT